jgi:hypothetical protein
MRVLVRVNGSVVVPMLVRVLVGMTGIRVIVRVHGAVLVLVRQIIFHDPMTSVGTPLYARSLYLSTNDVDGERVEVR